MCGWRARSARAVPKPQTMLVNDSYLVSLFCRRGKPSHSHCKGPAQISHCESQSGASLAGSHWLQTQKVMVMFKHTQLKHTFMHPALLACKKWGKRPSLRHSLKYFPEWDKWILYSKCPDLIHGPGLLSGLPYHQQCHESGRRWQEENELNFLGVGLHKGREIWMTWCWHNFSLFLRQLLSPFL